VPSASSFRSFERYEKCLVLLRAHEIVEFLGRAEFQAEEPALAFGLLIDRTGPGTERIVDGDDLAARGRIDVARRLDRFYNRRIAALLDLAADLRQLDIDDVAELLLCMLGDPDGRNVAVEPDPFVVPWCNAWPSILPLNCA
jgi:hypothetical protein